jgi:hypothetical protein
MAGSLNETVEKLKSEIGSHIAAIKSEPAWTQIEKLYRALGTIEVKCKLPKKTSEDVAQ